LSFCPSLTICSSTILPSPRPGRAQGWAGDCSLLPRRKRSAGATVRSASIRTGNERESAPLCRHRVRGDRPRQRGRIRARIHAQTTCRLERPIGGGTQLKPPRRSAPSPCAPRNAPRRSAAAREVFENLMGGARSAGMVCRKSPQPSWRLAQVRAFSGRQTREHQPVVDLYPGVDQ